MKSFSAPIAISASVWLITLAVLLAPDQLKVFMALTATLPGFIWLALARHGLPFMVNRFVALVFVVLVALVPIRVLQIQSANSPSEFSEEAWEVRDFNVRLSHQLNESTWIGSVQTSMNQAVDVLVRDGYSLSSFQRGCELKGPFRITPSGSEKVPWALKVQKGFKQDCAQIDLFSKLRQKFSSSLRGITTDATALVAGLAIGDTSNLSESLEQEMKALSLTHLTAVSGANCAIVIGIVILAVRRIRIARVMRVSLSMIALVGYVLLVGLEPSVIRAATMTSVLLLLSATGRSVRPIEALSWAVVLLVLIDPFIATQIGFALSVAATAGILALTPWVYSKLKSRIPRWLAGALAVAIAAQVWCLPILVSFQGGIATYSLLANVLVEPLVAPITVLGILAVLTAAVSAPVAGLFSWIASLASQLIVAISHFLAAQPLVTLWWPSGIFGISLMVLLGIAIANLALSKRRGLAVALITVFGIGLSAAGTNAASRSISWPGASWQIVNCDVGQGDALVVRSQGQIAVVDVGPDPKLIDLCLQRLDVQRVNLLVLTHFDADHIGGLEGLLKGRQIDRALVTEYQDDRPQVAFIKTQLGLVVPEVSTSHSGLIGQLGQIAWTVLEPELQGVGSEDTNDGSIVMRWESENFVLFTMADLGEKGQMRMAENHFGSLERAPGKPLVVKVSHHGSADQYFELLEHWLPEVALISVGEANSYGHPTKKVLDSLQGIGSQTFRTDQDGAIAIGVDSVSQRLTVQVGG